MSKTHASQAQIDDQLAEIERLRLQKAEADIQLTVLLARHPVLESDGMITMSQARFETQSGGVNGGKEIYALSTDSGTSQFVPKLNDFHVLNSTPAEFPHMETLRTDYVACIQQLNKSQLTLEYALDQLFVRTGGGFEALRPANINLDWSTRLDVHEAAPRSRPVSSTPKARLHLDVPFRSPSQSPARSRAGNLATSAGDLAPSLLEGNPHQAFQTDLPETMPPAYALDNLGVVRQADIQSPSEMSIEFVPPSRPLTSTFALQEGKARAEAKPKTEPGKRQQPESKRARLSPEAEASQKDVDVPKVRLYRRGPTRLALSPTEADLTSSDADELSLDLEDDDDDAGELVLSRSRTSSKPSLSLPQRDYVRILGSPDRSTPNAQNSKCVQKHPANFQCTLCPRKFTRAYNLRSHLRNHTNKRPFTCTVCDEAFEHQSDRERHEDLHSGKTKFACQGALSADGQWGCGRRFARADALARHFHSEGGRVCIKKPLLDEEQGLESLYGLYPELNKVGGDLPSALVSGSHTAVYNERSDIDASSGNEWNLVEDKSSNGSDLLVGNWNESKEHTQEVQVAPGNLDIPGESTMKKRIEHGHAHQRTAFITTDPFIQSVFIHHSLIVRLLITTLVEIFPVPSVQSRLSDVLALVIVRAVRDPPTTKVNTKDMTVDT
ncbi:hypothetical protein BDV97DRAFT_369796 [Delphinella strobiligena]|nr:hypothetical protein BDV97DRAFT_369796 [Delphinella strobiligena]